MDKMTHTKFNLNNFFMALSSSLDNTVKDNKYNTKYNSKRVAYIALRLAQLENLSAKALSDIFSYSVIFNTNISKEEMKTFPFLDNNIINNKSINKILEIAITVENNLLIQNDIIMNKDEIISLFDSQDDINKLFKDISFCYDLTSNYQLPFFIFSHLQDFTLELEFQKLIELALTINKIIYKYSNKIYSEAIDIKANKISEFYGFDDKDKARFIISALLSNLGILHISNNILLKPSKLNQSEVDIMKSVPYHTNNILTQVFGFDDIAKLCSYTYEKLDGSGYPYNIEANNLSLKNRILTILTIYQALEEKRSYRDSYKKEKILEILENEANQGKLDIAIVKDICNLL